MSTPKQPAWTPPPPRPHQQPGQVYPPPHQPDHENGAAPRRARTAAHDAHEHTRLALLIALSIAVVSVLGAVVGWRAEVHASKASRFDQDSVATSIAETQVHAEAEAAAAKAASKYSHYTKLESQANELMPKACSADSRSTLVELDAGALCETKVQFSGYSSDAYIDKNGNFDIEKYADDYIAGAKEQDPLDPERYKVLAEDERHHEDNMLYLSLFLALALALLTLARLGKSVPNRLILAVPGWMVLVGSGVFLAMAEF